MFALLFRTSQKSPFDDFRHAVLVMSGGRVMAIGYNTHQHHAEIHALQKLWPSERKHTKVVSVRFNKSGKLAMAKPCPECQKYLKKHGVKKVEYSDSNGHMQLLRLR